MTPPTLSAVEEKTDLELPAAASDYGKWFGQNIRQPFRFQIPHPNPPRCQCEIYLDGDTDPDCLEHGGKK